MFQFQISHIVFMIFLGFTMVLLQAIKADFHMFVFCLKSIFFSLKQILKQILAQWCYYCIGLAWYMQSLRQRYREGYTPEGARGGVQSNVLYAGCFIFVPVKPTGREQCCERMHEQNMVNQQA